MSHTPYGNTPHWDTPYGTAKPGGGSKLLLVLLVFLAGGGAICLLCMLLTLMSNEGHELNASAPASQTAEKTESLDTQVKNAELAKLLETEAKVKRIVNRKLLPVISRFKKDLRENKRELIKLRDMKKRKRNDTLKMKRFITERKEIKKFLKRLLSERDKYNEQLTELEFTVRRVKRNLEVSEFVNEDDRKEIARLLARGSALIESADKGFDKNSLESAVEDAKDVEADEELEIDMGELDDALADDDE
ncbi:MAG: hypothetical protein JKY65_10450 [Planctomycetes bacterium]|nr:hypothetical protein [Planctomycetota bacterium]